MEVLAELAAKERLYMEDVMSLLEGTGLLARYTIDEDGIKAKGLPSSTKLLFPVSPAALLDWLGNPDYDPGGNLPLSRIEPEFIQWVRGSVVQPPANGLKQTDNKIKEQPEQTRHQCSTVESAKLAALSTQANNIQEQKFVTVPKSSNSQRTKQNKRGRHKGDRPRIYQEIYRLWPESYTSDDRDEFWDTVLKSRAGCEDSCITEWHRGYLKWKDAKNNPLELKKSNFKTTMKRYLKSVKPATNKNF
jgi:hypothetical protein